MQRPQPPSETDGPTLPTAANAKTTEARPAESDPDRIVTFLRQRDYKYLKELGKGACGKTVLLRDDYIDQLYVCKKYSPSPSLEDRRAELFDHFVKEVKLLHKIYNRNVVRVFNHFLLPNLMTGYILMEFVDGSRIHEHIAKFPESMNDVFLQAVSGFRYLEQIGVLHRDIRTENLMVCSDGTLKIIDLGFGKDIRTSLDFKNSIELAWPYSPPEEIERQHYDFSTEVYFLGKLFEDLVRRNRISRFKYSAVLEKMCQHDADSRFASFAELDQQIGSELFDETPFAPAESEAYRQFADELTSYISRISNVVKYVDADAAMDQLNRLSHTFALETKVPNPALIVRCFLTGEYYFAQQRAWMNVSTVKLFLKLLKSCNAEKRRIVLANLHSRLDTIKRYDPNPSVNDIDVPF